MRIFNLCNVVEFLVLEKLSSVNDGIFHFFDKTKYSMPKADS